MEIFTCLFLFKFVFTVYLRISLDLCQHILKNLIVVLHSIIQVDPYHLIGEVMDFFFVDPDFLSLSLQCSQLFRELYALRSGCAINALFQIGDGRPVPGLLFMDIVRADTGNRVRLIAVHVYQALEAVLLPAVKEPVDRALLIHLYMIRVEVVNKIAPYFEIEEKNGIDETSIDYFCGENAELRRDIKTILDSLTDAKEYGSVLHLPTVNYDRINERFLQVEGEITVYSAFLLNEFRSLINAAEVMSRRYVVVATNPPYLNRFDEKLKQFIWQEYADYKGDMFSVFIKRNFAYAKPDGFISMMTPNVWMFLQSYEHLREDIEDQKSVISLIQFAKGAFFQEATVDICAFILKNNPESPVGEYYRLEQFKGNMDVQHEGFLSALSQGTSSFLTTLP